jgi:hypothetical protein
MSAVTLSILEIVNLCAFAGIAVDHESSVFNDDPELLDTELIIHQKQTLHSEDDGAEIYTGVTAAFCDHSEEGSQPLTAQLVYDNEQHDTPSPRTTVTLDEDGNALTETQEGITMPANYSFKTVNDFVHSRDVQYEDLECLCLGMANHIDDLNKR